MTGKIRYNGVIQPHGQLKMDPGYENEMTDQPDPAIVSIRPRGKPPRVRGGQDVMKQYDYIEADDCYDMAVEWMRNGNIEKAVTYFNRTIELNPRFTYAYIMLARSHAVKKNFTDAVHILKKASRLDPEFDRLPFLMAKYAYKNGDYKNALLFIDKALEIDENELYLQTKQIIEEMYHQR
jgi:tetratricopeptide (TPR) repeat protein